MRHLTFVVDTDGYAGNFQRELAAYLTGVLGEDEDGEDYAEDAEEHLSESTFKWLHVHVKQLADEEGMNSPSCLQPTPGWVNDGHGKDWPPGTPDSVILEHRREMGTAACEKSLREYADYINVSVTRGTPWDVAQARYAKAIEAIQQRLTEVQNLTQASKCPAFMSVGIYLDQEPPPEVLKELKERAHQFAAKHPKWCANVTGFRLITTTIVRTDESQDI